MRRWPVQNFTFRYYDGQYATAAETEASGAPTRTWAFKTNEKGRIRIMDESLKCPEMICFITVWDKSPSPSVRC